MKRCKLVVLGLTVSMLMLAGCSDRLVDLPSPIISEEDSKESKEFATSFMDGSKTAEELEREKEEAEESSEESTEEESSEESTEETSEETEESSSEPETDENGEIIETWTEDSVDSLQRFRSTYGTDGKMAAVAFLGHAGSYSGVSLEQLISTAGQTYGNSYAYMRQIHLCHVCDRPGEETYLLIPLSEEYSISIYGQRWNEDTQVIERTDLLYQGEPGEMIVVRGNESEIFSNFEIAINGGMGAYLYHPQLSMRDDRVSGDPGIVDYTDYNSVDVSFEEAGLRKLGATQMVMDEMSTGKLFRYLAETTMVGDQECLLYASGPEQDGQFVREHYYALSRDWQMYSYDAAANTWTEFQ